MQKMVNVPNVLTIVRICLVPLFMFFMYASYPYSNQIAFLLFSVAAFTDWLDGFLARRYELVTNIGKIMDPVADKIMVTAAMIVLVELGKLPGWIVVVMLFRDFAVGALRDMAATQGTIISAGFWGKLKTVMQMLALMFMIFSDDLVLWPLSHIGSYVAGTLTVNAGVFCVPVFTIGYVLICIALVASVFSGVIYFMQYSKVIKEKDAGQ